MWRDYGYVPRLNLMVFKPDMRGFLSFLLIPFVFRFTGILITLLICFSLSVFFWILDYMGHTIKTMVLTIRRYIARHRRPADPLEETRLYWMMMESSRWE